MPQPASRPALVLFSLAALLAPQDGDPPAGAPPDGRARELFLAHCATCHGEAGDGKGVSELDRPARSFRDGGFSFGNTPEALLRTITNGIPGTPMPAFDGALSEAERRTLVEHVIALGPEEPPAPPADTELVVTERPLVVRGHLPPIAEGAVERPRGLLVGLRSGLTAEYRTDDVRLLGLRLGGFVDRTDWIGRGGTALRPLGRVVELFDGGDPPAAFALVPAAGAGSGGNLVDLRARLRGTWVRGDEAGIRYALATPEGETVATVEESLRLVPSSVGAGFARRYRIDTELERVTLVPRAVRVRAEGAEAVDDGIVSWERRGPDWTLAGGQVSLLVEKEGEAKHRVSLLARSACLGGWALRYGHVLLVVATPTEPSRFEEGWFYTPEWNPETREKLFTEVLR